MIDPISIERARPADKPVHPGTSCNQDLCETQVSSRNSDKAHSHLDEVSVSGQNIGNAKFLHYHHRGEISERDPRLVLKPQPQSLGVFETLRGNPLQVEISILDGLFYHFKRFSSFGKRQPLEEQGEGLIQDVICSDESSTLISKSMIISLGLSMSHFPFIA